MYSQTRELKYALRHGSRFSAKHSVEEVRKGMERGKLPGDRVSVQSNKRDETGHSQGQHSDEEPR